MTPTARSLAYCKAQGWPVAVVEKWNPHAKIRQDAFGFIDLLVLVPGAILAVQATSGANHAARAKKIREVPAAASWCASGGRIAVWSWEKKGSRGKRKTWTLRTEAVEL